MFFDSYDTPVFRPPSETRSFILRLTRGCAHNHCTYCNMYRGVPFQVLTDEEISRQIAMAAQYGRDRVRRVFFADGDALVLKTERLLKILEVLRKVFPHFERAASYAAPRDILNKKLPELVQLREAGLEVLYYGMESGDTETLRAVRKGVDGPQSIEVGQRVIAAGMKLSVMFILGLAGVPGTHRHALETAKALSAIRPTYLGAISLMLYRGSELKDQFERGEFMPLSPAGLMQELYEIIDHLELPADAHTLFRSNHVSNYIPLAATLPAEKTQLLADISDCITELSQMKEWDVYNHDAYAKYYIR